MESPLKLAPECWNLQKSTRCFLAPELGESDIIGMLLPYPAEFTLRIVWAEKGSYCLPTQIHRSPSPAKSSIPERSVFPECPARFTVKADLTQQ